MIGWLTRRRLPARKSRAHDANRRAALAALAAERNPGRRAVLFMRAAVATRQLAELHTDVYGVDPVNDRHMAMPMSTSLHYQAALLWALSDVELSAGYGIERSPAVMEVEFSGGPTLDKMAAAVDLDERLALLDELHGVLVGIVGEHAASVLLPGEVAACVTR